MAQNSNQFSQSAVQGQLDLQFNGNTISCQIDSTSAGSLVAGQPMKIVNSSGGIPKIVECAADTDDVFGFLNYDMRRPTFAVGDKVEVSIFRGNVMYMTASAGIARNAKVAAVISGQKVVTATGTKVVIGRALDKAANNGDLIRVLIDLPGEQAEGVVAQAATVAALTGTLTGTANGSLVDIAATASAVAGGASPSAAQVDTGIALAVSTIVSGTNEQLKELQTTLNAALAALKAAGLMA